MKIINEVGEGRKDNEESCGKKNFFSLFFLFFLLRCEMERNEKGEKKRRRKKLN